MVLDFLVGFKIPTRSGRARELPFRVLRRVAKLNLGEIKRKLVGRNQVGPTAAPARLITGNQDVRQLDLVVLLLVLAGLAHRQISFLQMLSRRAKKQ